MKTFWTPKELSEEYPVSRSTIYGACRAGLIRHYRVPSGRGKKGKLLVREVDFLAWLETCRCEGEQAAEDEDLTFLK